MTLRVSVSTGPTGNCNADEIMVSAMCVTGTVPATPAGNNGAECGGGGANVRLVCAKR
jgi:hypothetical protein